MRGRKKTPTQLKLISGNPGKRPLNRNEPDPVGILLEPPEQMTDEQKAVWRHATDNAPKGLLRSLDRALFTEWVYAVAELNLAESMIRVEGPVVKQGGSQRITIDAKGNEVKTVRSPMMVPSPWTKIRREAFQRMLKATSELGFSPTSRSRITLAGADSKKETNRFSSHAAKNRA